MNNNRMIYDCGRMIFAAFLWIVSIPAIVVFAGDINSEEARLIQSVNITYEYEGKSYQVKGEYLSKLRSYLMRDDIDLTAQEVNEAIPQAMANVATGVADGYLIEIVRPATPTPVAPTPTPRPVTPTPAVPTPGESEPTSPVDLEETNPIDHTKPSTDEITKEDTKDNSPISSEESKEDAKDLEQTETKDTVESNQNSDSTTNAGTNQNSDNTQNSGTNQETVSTDSTQGAEQSQNVDSTDNTQNIPDIDTTETMQPETESDRVAEDTNVIKNTGFSIKATIIIGGAMMLLFLGTIVMAYRVSQFAHEDA